jgi:hypothetical protein
MSTVDKNKALLDSIVHDDVVVQENASPKKKRGEDFDSISSHSWSSAENFIDDELPTILNDRKGKNRSRPT